MFEHFKYYRQALYYKGFRSKSKFLLGNLREKTRKSNALVFESKTQVLK